MRLVRVVQLIVVILVGHISGLVTANAPVDFNTRYKSGLEISDVNNQFGFRLNGRLQADYINAAREDQTQKNQAQVKRVWLTLGGHYKDWYFTHRFDIDGDSELSSYIEYRGLGPMAHVSFGRHKEPFGMSWVGSIKHVTIPERSAISDRYTFGRSDGVMFSGRSTNWGYQVGLFEDGNSADENTDEEAKKMAVTGRVYVPLINDDNRVFHVGGDFSFRSRQDVFGLELAYVNGPWHLQSEWMNAHPEEGENIAGLYAEAGLFLTEDRMAYKNGVFKNVDPRNSGGAWQLVMRIDDGDGRYSDFYLGDGEGEAVAIGLNWYANAHVRWAMSYGYAEVAGSSGEEFRLRGQFTF